MILYPVIWRVSVRQLGAAIEALKAAKDLPATIGQLTEASERLKDVNREIADLRDKLDNLDTINQQLEIANRRIADLQKLNEERPPEPIQEAASAVGGAAEEFANWEEVSRLWFDSKEYVEKQVTKILDGRIRRKYNSIPRYTYDEITEYLKRDGILTDAKARAVNEMDSAFRSLRNRKTPVTAERVAAFRAWHDAVAGEDRAD
jgi:TolA-binding protein